METTRRIVRWLYILTPYLSLSDQTNATRITQVLEQPSVSWVLAVSTCMCPRTASPVFSAIIRTLTAHAHLPQNRANCTATCTILARMATSTDHAALYERLVAAI